MRLHELWDRRAEETHALRVKCKGSFLFSSSALNNHQLSPPIDWWWMKDCGICSNAQLLFIKSNTVIWQWSKSYRLFCLFSLGSCGWNWSHCCGFAVQWTFVQKLLMLAILVRVKIYQCFKFWQSILLCLLCNK